MNTKTMKSIDNNLGFAICLLLDTVEKISKLFKTRKLVIHPRSFLLIKFFGMGSIILGTPMYKAIKSKYPNSKITFLTFANNKPLLERIDFVDEIICLRTSKIRHFAADLLAAITKLRKKNIDVVIDMEFLAKASTIISWLSGAKIRIGFYVKQIWRADILTHKVYFNHYKHTKEIFMALLLPLEIPNLSSTQITPPKIFPADLDELQKQLDVCGFSLADNLIAININASETCFERRWPIENFIKLVNELSLRENIRFCFIGAQSELPYVKSGYDKLNAAVKKKAVNLCGKLSIGGAIALLSKAKLLITNDSGPLHLASSMGIPTVSLFGPETPALYGPLGDGHTIFYDGDLYCSPCLNVYNVKTVICKGDNECMRRIPVDKVRDAVINKLRN